MDLKIHQRLCQTAQKHNLDIVGGKVRRSSSRFCFGVEHGDYNGMELFGVGTDRYIWLGYKPNTSGKIRVFSENFPKDGVVEFSLHQFASLEKQSDSWARFPRGVAFILNREGYHLSTGFDAVLYGNIPGGGMSRSASLALNLILTFFEVNRISVQSGMRIVDLAQMVETDYIGSPCGKLDQIMIYFSKAGMGTYYNPKTDIIEHIPYGGDAREFRIVSMDTGTKRPGLEKSTYKIRRDECKNIQKELQKKFGYSSLNEIETEEQYLESSAYLSLLFPFSAQKRLQYLYYAKGRFSDTLNAWRTGNIQQIGRNFRADGIGLRDDYEISGKELESMCDIARTVLGVYGERMLGGGDKGASGALIARDAFDNLQKAIHQSYPLAHPDYAKEYAVHSCQITDGIVVGSLTC